jgi:hypothetical protein
MHLVLLVEYGKSDFIKHHTLSFKLVVKIGLLSCNKAKEKKNCKRQEKIKLEYIVILFQNCFKINGPI